MIQRLVSSKLAIFFLFASSLVSFSACERQESMYIPYVPVDFYLSLDIELASVGLNGHYIKPDAGVNGVILYRSDIDNWQAYDLTCTYKAFEEKCKIEFEDASDLLPHCPCCQSVFNLFNSAFPQGKSLARKPLQQYHVSRSGSYLRVTN